MEIKIIYGIAAAISLILIAGYCYLIRKRELWFVLLYVSVFVVNVGYFALSISGTLEEALLANRIAYLGSVFLPLCMLMIILDVCRMERSRWIMSVLIVVSVAVFLLAASGGYCEWYYKDVTLAFVDGAARLVKEYGPLHRVYYVYLFAYLMIMVVAILHAHGRKKVFDFKHAVLLVCVVMGNIGIWFIEQMIDVDFEFLSISYIITELFLLFLYDLLQDHGLLEKTTAPPVDEGGMDFEGILEKNPVLQTLTARELEVLKLILEDRKRKEMAEELNVTEHTVKKHTAHIFSKLEVSDRKELYRKIGYRP